MGGWHREQCRLLGKPVLPGKPERGKTSPSHRMWTSRYFIVDRRENSQSSFIGEISSRQSTDGGYCMLSLPGPDGRTASRPQPARKWRSVPLLAGHPHRQECPLLSAGGLAGPKWTGRAGGRRPPISAVK